MPRSTTDPVERLVGAAVKLGKVVVKLDTLFKKLRISQGSLSADKLEQVERSVDELGLGVDALLED